MTIAVSGAFALPVAALASAASDNFVLAQAGGGGDTGATNRQEGASPPGQASPGAPRSTTSGMDRSTGAARHTNPGANPSGGGSTTRHGRFDALDKNHDGYISRDEASNASELNTRFSELDRNNDGKLSRSEYGALHSSARGSTTSGKGAMSGKARAPGKGPGAQEPANRALGSAGSGQPEGGGTSSTTK